MIAGSFRTRMIHIERPCKSRLAPFEGRSLTSLLLARHAASFADDLMCPVASSAASEPIASDSVKHIQHGRGGNAMGGAAMEK